MTGRQRACIIIVLIRALLSAMNVPVDNGQCLLYVYLDSWSRSLFPPCCC